MKERTKITKDSIALCTYLDTFDSKQRAEKVNQIAAGCFVSRYVVYNWTYGLTRIPELFKRKIEEICNSQIFAEPLINKNDIN